MHYLVLILTFPGTIVDCNFLYESGVLSSQMAGRIQVMFFFSFTYKIMMPQMHFSFRKAYNPINRINLIRVWLVDTPTN